MSRPLHRGVSGGLRLSGSNNDLWDSQMKDRTEKEDLDRRGSDQSIASAKFPYLLHLSDNSTTKNGINENGFASDSLISGTPRSRHKLAMLLLKFSLISIVILALTGSFWWTISISASSRGHIFHGYRRLQEQLVVDLWDIGELSLGSSRLKELEFCPEEFEHHVPCFNVSDNIALGYTDGNEYDRFCGHGSRENCLVLPPVKYKIPLRWPTGKDVIWFANVKYNPQERMSSTVTRRMMMLEEEQIAFRSDSPTFDGIEDYSHQIAEMIGLRNESSFIHIGVRTILDIGCGFGSFGAHLSSSQLLTMCVANYEASRSQVQLTSERGLPAMIGSFTSKQLPYPSLSFDMVHCAWCGIDWAQKDGIYLNEVDRLLKPGGYFVWTSQENKVQRVTRTKEKQKITGNFVQSFAENLCWKILSTQEGTIIWKKTSKRNCYSSRKSSSGPSICSKSQDVETPYYRPLQACIGGTQSHRWIPVEDRTTWPSRANLNKNELALFGLHPEEFAEDTDNWQVMVRNYWSLLSPLIFSDHPKRPGDEDPSPPYNMLRNVLDMNANFGGFNAALLGARKSVWVMNVVPTNGPNYLPLIMDRGFVGVLHDWCEAFPTYPRTYDLVHAAGLLSLESVQQRRCTTLDLFTEIDRILRPEGWVIIRDTAPLIESARTTITRLKWDARVVEVESNSDERLLICQKPFFKRQSK
ncbi:hypothetical protein ACB092_10G172200 [Castanea dentata]